MLKLSDSHIEFIHHKKDLKDPKVLNFISSQVSPEMINRIGCGLFFLAVYVEATPDAFEKVSGVINSYLHEIQKNKWNLVLGKGDIKDGKINIVLHLEDLFCIGRDLGKIDELYLMGIRSIGLTHNMKNQFSGGALEGDGLTKLGEKAINNIIARNMILDLAHISGKGFRDVMHKFNIKPFISHCGLRSLLDNPRNVSDDILEYIKKRDGYVGIGCAGSFLSKSDASADDFIGQIKYAQKVCEKDRVGIGSDFGGIISYVPKNLENLSKLNDLRGKLSNENIFSKNLLKFLHSVGY